MTGHRAPWRGRPAAIRRLAASVALAAAACVPAPAPAPARAPVASPGGSHYHVARRYGLRDARGAEERGYPFELAAPSAAAWDELPAVYRALGLPLSFTDEVRRELGSDGWSVAGRVAGERPSRWVDCGRGLAAPHADAWDLVLRVRSAVTATASGSRVVTVVGGSASPRDASGGAVACTSRGTLEERIGDLLHERLRKKAT